MYTSKSTHTCAQDCALITYLQYFQWQFASSVHATSVACDALAQVFPTFTWLFNFTSACGCKQGRPGNKATCTFILLCGSIRYL